MDSKELAAELRQLAEFGFTHLDVQRAAASASGAISPVARRVVSVQPDGEKLASLRQLSELASGCTLCRLSTTRTQVVFGTGNPAADLMFIGEAPGRDEDLAGEPFVGRAGQLLTDIIKAMKFSREEVYITNVVKCRPPENRNPELDEMDACRPYLQKQIELIQPKVIVTLGRFALQSTLQQALAISSVRGVWQDYRGIRLMPTYHPAYLLRNPSAKKDVWSDMKKVIEELGLV